MRGLARQQLELDLRSQRLDLLHTHWSRVDSLQLADATYSMANIGGKAVNMKITMKVAMNVDCTPDEARRLWGLPDMKPMEEVQQRLSRNLQLIMDPEAMLKAWLPATLKGFEQSQANSFRK